MVEVSWGSAFGDYESLADDLDSIVLSTDAPKRRASMRDCIRVVELALPIYIDGEPCRHFGINESAYGGRRLMWPFSDDENFSTIRYSNSEPGRTVGEWVNNRETSDHTFDDAVNWLKNKAIEGARFGETE